MKIFFVIFVIFQTGLYAQSKCSFVRHQFIEVVGESVPKELKNKILNEFNPDNLILIKENKELGLKICSKLQAFHNLNEIQVQGSKMDGEALLTKVFLRQQNDFWFLQIESFVRSKEGKLISIYKSDEERSGLKVNQLKNIEAVSWIYKKILSQVK